MRRIVSCFAGTRGMGFAFSVHPARFFGRAVISPGATSRIDDLRVASECNVSEFDYVVHCEIAKQIAKLFRFGNLFSNLAIWLAICCPVELNQELLPRNLAICCSRWTCSYSYSTVLQGSAQTRRPLARREGACVESKFAGVCTVQYKTIFAGLREWAIFANIYESRIRTSLCPLIEKAVGMTN